MSDDFTPWPEARTNLFRKELWLLPGREVADFVEFADIDDYAFGFQPTLWTANWFTLLVFLVKLSDYDRIFG